MATLQLTIKGHTYVWDQLREGEWSLTIQGDPPKRHRWPTDVQLAVQLSVQHGIDLRLDGPKPTKDPRSKEYHHKPYTK